jgi:hypothetical protein
VPRSSQDKALKVATRAPFSRTSTDSQAARARRQASRSPVSSILVLSMMYVCVGYTFTKTTTQGFEWPG